MSEADDQLTKVVAALPIGYTVIAPCGKGGQGTVFRGTHNGRAAALKIFSPESPRDIERIRREVAILQKITTPSVVRLLDATEIQLDGRPYPLLAYEYHPGGDLRELLKPGPALSEEEILHIGRDVSAALASLWENRVVHRDVKPANIVVSAEKNYVLVDIGIARHLDLASLTAFGRLGTLGYMSPEQAIGRKKLTVLSDTFSLGITLYHLAAKLHPFNGDQHAIGRTRPRDLKEVRGDLSENLVRFIHSMMATTAVDRPLDIVARFEKFTR